MYAKYTYDHVELFDLLEVGTLAVGVARSSTFVHVDLVRHVAVVCSLCEKKTHANMHVLGAEYM